MHDTGIQGEWPLRVEKIYTDKKQGVGISQCENMSPPNVTISEVINLNK